jgi:hypothetical protein
VCVCDTGGMGEGVEGVRLCGMRKGTPWEARLVEFSFSSCRDFSKIFTCALGLRD